MKIVQLLLLGVSLGSIYALIALGYVAIYKGTKVINLAHGSVMLLGAYVVSLVSDRSNFYLGVAAGLLVAGIGAMVVERVVALARTEDHLVLTILTIGVDIVLATELSRRIGTEVFSLGDPWGDARVEIFGTVLPQARIAALVVGTVVITAFFVVFRKTDFGARMRASAADPETAALMGISQRKVALVSWAVGGALACIAGIFLACFPNPGLDHHSGVLALNAIPAIIIGGLDSSEGAVFGGLIVGVTQSLVQGYADELSFLGENAAAAAPYAVMLVFLLVRPAGLLGSKELTRV
jgi:branched-chain amino acid transport system permease protein